MMLTKQNEDDISRICVDAAFKVHQQLGSGLLESAYQECLFYELNKRNLFIEKEKELPVIYDGLKIKCGYRMDLMVENELVIELKAVEKLMPLHTAQLLTYLKLSNIKTGLLINFNSTLIKDGIKRISL